MGGNVGFCRKTRPDGTVYYDCGEPSGGGWLGDLARTLAGYTPVGWFDSGGSNSPRRVLPPAPVNEGVGGYAFDVDDVGRLNRIGGVTRDATRPVSRGPSAASFPFVFGAAAPSPATPGPTRRPSRRRRSRPTRRGRPARPTRPARPPDPRIPEAPEPPTTAPRRAPSRRPSPIPVDIPTSVPDALFGLWRRLLDEYLRGPKRRPSPAGGPRRGGSRTGQVDLPPGRGNIPVPGPLTVELPTPQGRPEPSEIFSPRAPISSPFPDPYTYVPAPAPSPSPSRAARANPLLQLGNPVPWSLPQVRPGTRRQPRRQDRREPRRPPRDTPNSGLPRSTPQGLQPGLTPLQPGRIELPSQSSNPCQQAARDAKRRQRRRRKECTKWVTKEIRVCQSSNAR